MEERQCANVAKMDLLGQMTHRFMLFVALAAAAECFSPPLPNASPLRCLSTSASSNVAALYSRSMNRPLPARPQLRMEAGEGLDLGRKAPLFEEQMNLLYDSKCSVCRWEVGRRHLPLDACTLRWDTPSCISVPEPRSRGTRPTPFPTIRWTCSFR